MTAHDVVTAYWPTAAELPPAAPTWLSATRADGPKSLVSGQTELSQSPSSGPHGPHSRPAGPGLPVRRGRKPVRPAKILGDLQ
jgi:hypothetical protein